MNLTYSVLWFDDVEDVFHSMNFDPLNEAIRSWGFNPVIELVTSPEELMSKVPFSHYDLIVIDFNLSEHEKHGDEFIEKIRGNKIFTEIVFYSAQPASYLWDAVREKQLEGVYVANRGNVLTKIEQVARQSVKKVLDLPNMRGIVMAEVGDIDFLLDSIIESGIVDLKDEERSRIFGKFHSQAVEQHQGFGKDLDEFKNKPSSAGMLNLCDSYKRWLCAKRLITAHPKVNEKEVGDYNEDVIMPRNFLAHGKPSSTDNGFIFEYRGKSYSFDDEVGKNIRNNIRQYKEKFLSIKRTLSKKD